MHEDATTDVGPVPVIGDTAPPEPEPESVEPERDALDELDDTMLPVQRVEQQIQRTDDALRKWREESVRRRQEWEDAQAEAEVEAELRRGRLRIAAGAAVVLIAAVAAAGVTALAALDAALSPEVASLPVVPEVAEVEVVEPSPEPEIVAMPPVVEETVDEVDAVAEVVEEEAAPVDPTPAPVQLRRDTVELWQADGLSWVRGVIDSAEPGYMEWLDASGTVALEPMSCGALRGDGSRMCTAGRSRSRIRHALAQGAEPGTWTVRICGSAGCATAGTFEVAPL